ncbi:AdoMet-dependent rRNA methyltransferase spb1 [Vanrija albida]|uniref:AdoMet-dependent rRNA methyltransferase spb1 n=1 Tax=Vanrija albida TaxID=181172 RepID=A0ABR3PS61_9TREE
MGKHDKKSGKGRLDKFYRLAKEQGYRARSAFKLVHLNRKYDLLSKSKCTIDLCAAPGGWLQVAEKYMPKGSLIIGVDLVPIKPLPHVITFQADITTPACRNELRQHMHDWKADLVLHDGAPNVGAAWIQDAFTQNELVLQSLKLATEFLIKGGNFVTKVFRSKDYNSLMWVFGQLFRQVEATKPPSSRNVSAEIFVVCRDFIAPKYIDPKFLDPKHVFKDLAALPESITEPEAGKPGVAATQESLVSSANLIARLAASNNHAHANVYNPEKKRRARDGYEDGDYTLFHKAPVSAFIKGDGVAILGTMNEIVFETEEEKEWLKSRHTTPDVLANFADLKVLGKREFKELMKWRLAIRLEIGLDVKADANADATEEVEVEPMDEEEQITEELKKLHEERLSKQKREKKRKNEIKTRTIQKLQLGMTAPTDLDMEDRALAGEDEIFDLGEGERELRGRGNLHDTILDADGLSDEEEETAAAPVEESDDEVYSSDEERELRAQALEGELDGLYDDYKERMAERDAKWKVKQQRLKDANYGSWHGINEGEESDDGVDKGYRDQMVRRFPRRGDDEEDEGEESEDGGWDLIAAQKAKIGEEVDSDDSDEEGEAGPSTKAPKKKAAIRIRDDAPAPAQPKKLVTTLAESQKRAAMSRNAQVWFDQSVFKGVGDLDALAALDGDDESEDGDDESGDDDESDAEMDEDEESDVDMDSSLESTLDDKEDEDEDDFEIVPQEKDEEPEWDVENEDQDEVLQKQIKSKGLLTAEAVSIAHRLANRQTTADKLIDEGFNRLSTHNKDGLPSWFLDDESKFYRPNIPITKEAVDALKERQRALDARPIKKVAEAKWRKKLKAHQRLERAKKRADGVMETEDLNDGEKARQVSKLLRRAAAGEKHKERKVVVARASNKGIQGRPKGVKGKYKMVDARMRKEVRALKRVKKAEKKKRR